MIEYLFYNRFLPANRRSQRWRVADSLSLFSALRLLLLLFLLSCFFNDYVTPRSFWGCLGGATFCLHPLCTSARLRFSLALFPTSAPFGSIFKPAAFQAFSARAFLEFSLFPLFEEMCFFPLKPSLFFVGSVLLVASSRTLPTSAHLPQFWAPLPKAKGA